MQNKLCLIFDTPSMYREAIHRKIDGNYDCDWYFGDYDYQVKKYDTSVLKNVSFLHVIQLSRWIDLHITLGMLRLLLKKEYDRFFLVGEPRNITIWLFALCRKFLFQEKKLYFWCHGWYGKESWYEKVIKKIVYESADSIFTYGEYAKQMMMKNGFDGRKIHPIHNSLNYDIQLDLRKKMKESGVFREHFKNEYPTIIFIGRLTRVKKLNILIDAIHILKKRGFICNLVCVGDGAMKIELSQQVCQLDLETTTWFYGACYDEEENAKLVYNADLCVAPGNVGLTAIHCMMFGTPVISHNCFKYQMPEFEAIKPNKTGDFFDYGNVLSLVDTIERWLKNQGSDRQVIREMCFNEIDVNWNPYYQMNVITKYIR